MFDRGIASCLKYIEAVPWSESDEEKLKSWFARYKFDEAISQDVQARLFPQGPNHSEVLALQLIRSFANGVNSDARKEMQCRHKCSERQHAAHAVAQCIFVNRALVDDHVGVDQQARHAQTP